MKYKQNSLHPLKGSDWIYRRECAKFANEKKLTGLPGMKNRQNKTQLYMLSQEIRKMIEDKLGMEIKYPNQCEVVAQAIEDVTGQTIGLSTIKRMYGFINEGRIPRQSTLDILSAYLGYKDYKLMAKDLNEDSDISDFMWMDSVEPENLAVGTQLQITYDPKRLLILTYLGDFKFIVNESKRSKLQKGDTLEIHQLVVGHELVVNEVIRDGESKGSYTGAKQGGLTSIEIFN